MARVTVEDCVDKVPNRFELVMMAAQRARRIGSGAPLTVDRDKDKNPVVSLREIAGETIAIDDIREELIRNNQRIIALDDDEEDVIDLMDGEREWNSLSGADDDSEADEEPDADEPEAETRSAPPGLQDMAGVSEES